MIKGSIQVAMGKLFGGPAPKLERAITYLQGEGYGFELDGVRLGQGDELAVQIAARRLAAGMMPFQQHQGEGLDLKTRSSLAQSLGQGARQLANQLLGWTGLAAGASAYTLSKLEDVTGPEVLRLAQLVKDGSEDVLSITQGQMQKSGAPPKPYRGLRFKPFPWGKWSVSVNLLAELSPRSVLEEETRGPRSLAALAAESR